MRIPCYLAAASLVCLAFAACVHQSSRHKTPPGDGRSIARVATNLSETNVTGHPLEHPQFRMITAPQWTWNTHWMYPNDVMAYLLKDRRDAALAQRVLAEYGLGRGDQSYLFVAREGAPLVVNGTVFTTRSEAVAFIRKQKIPKLLYVPENNAFPTQIPVWLDQEGIPVWVLKWQK